MLSAAQKDEAESAGRTLAAGGGTRAASRPLPHLLPLAPVRRNGHRDRMSAQGCGMKSQCLRQGQQTAPRVRPRLGSDPAAPKGAAMAARGSGSRGPRARGNAATSVGPGDLTHMLLKRNRSSHVKARSVVIVLPPPLPPRPACRSPRPPRRMSFCAGSPRGGAGNCFRATSCSATKAAARLPLATGIWNCRIRLVKSPGSSPSESQNYTRERDWSE